MCTFNLLLCIHLLLSDKKIDTAGIFVLYYYIILLLSYFVFFVSGGAFHLNCEVGISEFPVCISTVASRKVWFLARNVGYTSSARWLLSAWTGVKAAYTL